MHFIGLIVLLHSSHILVCSVYQSKGLQLSKTMGKILPKSPRELRVRKRVDFASCKGIRFQWLRRSFF